VVNMHPELKQGTKIEEAIFTDPLTDVTRKVRRNLLVISTFAILLKVYDLKITKTPWLNIEVPKDSPHLLEGIIAVSLLYLFIVYVIYLTQDLNRWKVGGHVLVTKGNWDLFLNTRNDIHVIKQHIDKFDPEKPKPAKFESIEKAVDKALDRLPKSQEKLDYLESQYFRLTIVQWIRLGLIEIGVPLLIGLYALLNIWDSILPFLTTVATHT